MRYMPKCSKCYKDYRVFLRDDAGLCLDCFMDELIDDGREVQIYPVDHRAGGFPNKS